jgi:hypothetical protein
VDSEVTGGIHSSIVALVIPEPIRDMKLRPNPPSTIVYIHEHQDNSTHPNTTTM